MCIAAGPLRVFQGATGSNTEGYAADSAPERPESCFVSYENSS